MSHTRSLRALSHSSLMSQSTQNSYGYGTALSEELSKAIEQIIAQGSIPFLDEAMLTSEEFQQYSQGLSLELSLAQAIRSHSASTHHHSLAPACLPIATAEATEASSHCQPPTANVA